jgi:hypothetical protein
MSIALQTTALDRIVRDRIVSGHQSIGETIPR